MLNVWFGNEEDFFQVSFWPCLVALASGKGGFSVFCLRKAEVVELEVVVAMWWKWKVFWVAVSILLCSLLLLLLKFEFFCLMGCSIRSKINDLTRLFNLMKLLLKIPIMLTH